MKKCRDKVPFLLLVGCMFLCWFFVLRQGVFGSEIDWISQHSVIPDYFRQNFYSSGSFFSNFAPQLGGGQNLFHFSYYGLFNPIILVSYLLPFVTMSDYIMWSSAICYGVSVVLFYLWIRNKCAYKWMAVGIVCMFSLSAPLLYHFYNQLMFVNYMPFLCLALMGTDCYIKKQKSSLLIFGTVGMILCSFYFSIGGMIALVLYAISEYCKVQDKIQPCRFLCWLIQYGIRLGIAAFMCSILLVPTAFALHREHSEGIKWSLSWLIPEIVPKKLLFHPHGIGLSILTFLILLRGLFYRSWRERLLSIFLLILFVIPAFGYLLNGGLYNKTKVFIPFLPICCYLWIPYLNSLKERYREKLSIILPFASALVLFVVDYGIHTQAQVAVSKEFYEQVNSQTTASWMNEEITPDTTLIRTEELGDHEENKANINRIHTMDQFITSIYSSAYNVAYASFRKDTFQLNETYRNNMMQEITDNPCFLKLMGVKYLFTKECVPGYDLKETKDGKNLWVNDNALPMIYATNQLMSKQCYETLAFPENQAALLWAAVVEKAQKNLEVPPTFQEVACNLPEIRTQELQVGKITDGYEIAAEEETQVSINLRESVTEAEQIIEQEVKQQRTEDNLLAISFEVENLEPTNDMYIKVETQENLLTAEQHEYANNNHQFTYLLGIESDQVKIVFGKGKYRLHNVKLYTGSWEKLDNTGICQYAFQSKEKEWYTKWNGVTYMEGTIQANEGSYLITSIPFDEGFSIYVDGDKVEAEMVNTAFLGCKLSEGLHQIRIEYEAKGFQGGVVMTLLGSCLCGFLLMNEKKHILQTLFRAKK